MRTVVFATGDVKPGKLGVEIAKNLTSRWFRRVKVEVFATDPSAKIWRDAGFQVRPESNLADVISYDKPPKERPIAVVIGLSSPKSTEGQSLEIVARNATCIPKEETDIAIDEGRPYHPKYFPIISVAV